MPMIGPKTGCRVVLFILITLSCMAAPAAAQSIDDHFDAPYTRQYEETMTSRIYAQIERYLDQYLHEVTEGRSGRWGRDLSSDEAYEASIRPNRDRFMRLIGLYDERSAPRLERFAVGADPILVAETASYIIEQVRWPVVEGIEAQGLLLTPHGEALARVVALPDADQSPEQLAGLVGGIAPESQFARRMAENGFQVLIPLLVDRSTSHTRLGPAIPSQPWLSAPGFTQHESEQNHREWVWRQAYVLGRHLIGYEVQTVLAGIDALAEHSPAAPIGVAGYGEGGLIAFYAAAVDRRIDAALVSGYFGPREQLWSEPVERNIWGLLTEFGDAEIASMIVPRPLIIEHSTVPPVKGPLPGSVQHPPSGHGRLVTPTEGELRSELERLEGFFHGGAVEPRVTLISDDGHPVAPGSDWALAQLADGLGVQWDEAAATQPHDTRSELQPSERMRRHIEQFTRRSERLAELAEYERYQYLAAGDRDSPAAWRGSMDSYRDVLYEELIGQLPESDAQVDLNSRTRKILDFNDWEGHEVVIDVLPGVHGWGLLALPKDIQLGERRPVVIVQHGVFGSPTTPIRVESYNHILPKLVERGFIVFSPFAPYVLNTRKANPLQASVFSFIIPQHQQMVHYLQTHEAVDPDRIGFYGKSFGGRAGLYVGPFVPEWRCMISSAFFNMWPRKAITTDWEWSYMRTPSIGVYKFNQANMFGHAELVGLGAPRPVMIEAGYQDAVAPAEWIGFEFAKVKRLYDQLGIGERAVLGAHMGGHVSHDDTIFPFLHKCLTHPVQPTDRFGPLRDSRDWFQE